VQALESTNEFWQLQQLWIIQKATTDHIPFRGQKQARFRQTV